MRHYTVEFFKENQPLISEYIEDAKRSDKRKANKIMKQLKIYHGMMIAETKED